MSETLVEQPLNTLWCLPVESLDQTDETEAATMFCNGCSACSFCGKEDCGKEGC